MFAVSYGAEFKVTGTGGRFLFDSDKLVHILGFFAEEVLKVNYGSSAGVLGDIGCRLFAANVDPTGVKLGLEQVCGNSVVENVERIFAVNGKKFKIVVVIEKRKSLLVISFCHRGKNGNASRDAGGDADARRERTVSLCIGQMKCGGRMRCAWRM